MADVRTSAGGAKNAAAETARKAAQMEWAMEQLGGEPNKVVIVPNFKLVKGKWVPTEDIIRQGNNKAFASLLLMSYPNGATGRERWQDKQWSLAKSNNAPFLITALAPMPIEDAETYTAGQVLDGRIDTAYTKTPPNPNNADQDRWFLNRDAVELDIPVTDEDGSVWYQKRYFEDDLSYPVPQAPQIDRKRILEEIAAAKAA